jgi:hypothetical protein
LIQTNLAGIDLSTSFLGARLNAPMLIVRWRPRPAAPWRPASTKGSADASTTHYYACVPVPYTESALMNCASHARLLQ